MSIWPVDNHNHRIIHEQRRWLHRLNVMSLLITIVMMIGFRNSAGAPRASSIPSQCVYFAVTKVSFEIRISKTIPWRDNFWKRDHFWNVDFEGNFCHGEEWILVFPRALERNRLPFSVWCVHPSIRNDARHVARSGLPRHRLTCGYWRSSCTVPLSRNHGNHHVRHIVSNFQNRRFGAQSLSVDVHFTCRQSWVIFI